MYDGHLVDRSFSCMLALIRILLELEQCIVFECVSCPLLQGCVKDELLYCALVHCFRFCYWHFDHRQESRLTLTVAAVLGNGFGSLPSISTGLSPSWYLWRFLRAGREGDTFPAGLPPPVSVT